MIRPSRKSYVVAIGGLDPSGHAGILADTRVLQDLKIPYRAVATAITAQSEKRFLAWKAVDLKLFRQELAAVEGMIFGIKIGMLASPSHLKLLLTWLKKVKPRYLLWDPVRRSSTGMDLLKPSTLHASFFQLLKICDIFTPNLPEAEWLLGRKIKNLEEMETAAQEFHRMGRKTGRMAIIKGGHLPKISGSREAVDVVFDGKKIVKLRAPRRPSNPRGTGCSFGSALLAQLYRRKDPVTAAELAKNYVLAKLFDAPAL